ADGVLMRIAAPDGAGTEHAVDIHLETLAELGFRRIDAVASEEHEPAQEDAVRCGTGGTACERHGGHYGMPALSYATRRFAREASHASIGRVAAARNHRVVCALPRSEEHTSELQ